MQKNETRKMKKLLIVGAGQLGSRHLQALAGLSGDTYQISVVDPVDASLIIAKQRYQEVSLATSPNCNFVHSLETLAGELFEVAVVATNAAIRLQVVKALLQQVKVKFLILEKVLFQSVAQLDEACELLAEHGVKSWVNCPRRQFVAYQELAERFKHAQSLTLNVRGYNWGLGCNAIHFVDLWHYFTDFSDYSLYFAPDCRIIDSKRSGYKEVLGSLSASSQDQRHHLSLSCLASEDSQVSLEIEATCDNERYQLSEREGEIRHLDAQGGVIERTPMQIRYQSQLTNEVVQTLVATGECPLTPLSISAMLHKPFLMSAAALFEPKSPIDPHNLAPIT
ncbi:hypothetical protein FG475_07500 [Vibrio navarrensis]|nr:hypothetical protein [Vibrio navarrensis]